MIDNLPEWKAYPKRSKSVICSTNLKRSIVFAKNGAKFGVCPEGDIWFAFKNQFDFPRPDLEAINNMLVEIFDISDRDFSTMKKQMEKIDELYVKDEDKFNSVILSKIIPFIKSEGNLFNAYRKILNPKNNGFKIMTVKDDLPFGKEVWTDAPCLMVKAKYFSSLFPI
jgi:hypothetical protein